MANDHITSFKSKRVNTKRKHQRAWWNPILGMYILDIERDGECMSDVWKNPNLRACEYVNCNWKKKPYSKSMGTC